MKVRASLLSLGFLTLTACAPSASSDGHALSASPSVQRYGVARYAVADEGATLLDASGTSIGEIHVRQAENDRRLISIAMSDGSGDDVEVYRPIDGRFELKLRNDLLSSALLLDPALASLWGRFDIHTTLNDSAVKTSGLDVSDLASCLPANGASGCYNNDSTHPCYSNYDYVEYNSPDSAMFISDYWTCQSFCGDYFEFYFDTSGDSGPGYYCICGTRYTQMTYPASCPRASCTTVGQRDQVDRSRSCMDPGSCVNQSPYVGCANW